MRGHGAAITAPTLQRVVARTIFLSLNATLQADAMRMGVPITYLDIEDARKIEARGPWAGAHLGRLEEKGDGQALNAAA